MHLVIYIYHFIIILIIVFFICIICNDFFAVGRNMPIALLLYRQLDFFHLCPGRIKHDLQ